MARFYFTCFERNGRSRLLCFCSGQGHTPSALPLRDKDLAAEFSDLNHIAGLKHGMPIAERERRTINPHAAPIIRLVDVELRPIDLTEAVLVLPINSYASRDERVLDRRRHHPVDQPPVDQHGGIVIDTASDKFALHFPPHPSRQFVFRHKYLSCLTSPDAQR